MDYLTPEEKELIIDAFINADFDYKEIQYNSLDGIDSTLRHKLLATDFPHSSAQLMHDLKLLSGAKRLNNNEVPLLRWLKNVEREFETLHEQKIFTALIEKVKKRVKDSKVALSNMDDSLPESVNESDEDTILENDSSEEEWEESELETEAQQQNARWIQAEVWEQNENEIIDVIEQGFLYAGNSYDIAVFIGLPSKTSISGKDTFDDDLLPWDEDEHELMVVLSEPQILSEPKVGKITLPRIGNSTRCGFALEIPVNNVSQINARIIISYKNRVLQSALLKSFVFQKDEEPKTKDNKIELITESMIRPGMSELSERREFDASLILNHDTNNEAQITKLINDDAHLISIEGVSDKLKWFDSLITKVANEWEKFEELTNKKSVDLLRNCAINGRALYKAMMAGHEENNALVLAKAQRLQIVSARYGARFPLEFVYGRRAPDNNAPLCPNTQKALKAGHCDEDCPTGERESEVVCPLGFWGLNRVIERHAYDAKALRELGNVDFALQSEPVAGRNHLNVLTNSIIATSNNVDAVDSTSSKRVVDELEKATTKNTIRVENWKKWKEGIKTNSPSLLVLLPHTVEDIGLGQQMMEISEGEQLRFASLEAEYILSDDKDPKPIVILMGCDTASPDISYENFVLAFRSMGAALVVGTGSAIIGRHAATVTIELIKAIKKERPDGIPFGDLLLQIRRELMAEGLLMVMCLTSYGDTDWII